MKLGDKTAVRAGVKNCTVCGGVGFVYEEIVSGTVSGALSLCSCVGRTCMSCYSKGRAPYLQYDSVSDKMLPCECHEARIEIQKIESQLLKSKIPPKYKYKFLSSISTEGNRMSLLIAHDWANDLLQNWQNQVHWKNRRKGMYLWGGTGSGKTLLACAILNELIFRYGTTCRYAKINKDFLSALKDTYQKDSINHGMERSIEEEFANIDVLVIDDFGVQKESEWVNAKLYDLIDSRYEKQKTTLLTSNTPPDEWKALGEGRVYSRLKEMTQDLHIECEDYRLKF